VRLDCEPTVAFSAAMERMRRLRAGISSHDSVERFTKLGVDVFIGNGRFVGPSAVEVDGQRLEFDRAVIATGARASEPAGAGVEGSRLPDQRDCVYADRIAAPLAVIGAGPIGCELAQASRASAAKCF
jgi:pyruvate/2-oxoglutarate dehydrogenase complex dihydrolipoamide dehydrogenase (E3) component